MGRAEGCGIAALDVIAGMTSARAAKIWFGPKFKSGILLADSAGRAAGAGAEPL